METTNWYIPN